MKKVIYFTLLCILLNCNIVNANPQVESNILKEGVYSVSNIIESLGNIHYVQNISTNDSIYFALLDENKSVIQTLKMKPNSNKYMLSDLEPNYKIIVLGDGEIFLSK
ncbi:hypothetical protein [Clostridium sp.]|uniref:hypothetical protein n=1 Tax=Clostridium sp. TaxID=1506 RepID=UPI0026121313|nr:hypothetical protein [Clostridium sp.]